MFELGNHYLDHREPGDNRFIKNNRAACPKCGTMMIRRVEKGEYYFEHCRRIFLDNRIWSAK